MPLSGRHSQRFVISITKGWRLQLTGLCVQSPTEQVVVCSQCRHSDHLFQHGRSTTLRHCFTSYTGYECQNEFNTSCAFWYTSACMAQRRRTWPVVFEWSQTLTHVTASTSFRQLVDTARAIHPSLHSWRPLLRHGRGTVCHLQFAMPPHCRLSSNIILKTYLFRNSFVNW